MLVRQEDTSFDVLSTLGEHTLLCHEPREGVDGRQTFEHHPFLFDGAPHAHFLPCHLFSHTNLQSPCAEQGR